MLCLCGCKTEFEPKRRNQIYVSAEHRKRDSNRRWPVRRQSVLPWASRNGLGGRREAKTSYVTLLLGTQMARTKSGTLLAGGDAFGQARARRKLLLTTAEVAEFLRVSTWTVRAWRMQQIGPPFIKIGGWAIRYPWAALVAYLQRNLFDPAPKIRGSRSLLQPQTESDSLHERRADQA